MTVAKLTTNELNNHLWKSADICVELSIRAIIKIIFLDFFLKRLSDVFEEEAEKVYVRRKKAGRSEQVAKQVAWGRTG